MDNCLNCASHLVSDREWRNATQVQRDTWVAAGTLRRMGRGLCSRCYGTARLHGTLDQYPRTNRPWSETLEEWHFLANPRRTHRENVRHLAPQLGMSEEALHRALVANQVRSPFDSQGRPKAAA